MAWLGSNPNQNVINVYSLSVPRLHIITSLKALTMQEVGRLITTPYSFTGIGVGNGFKLINIFKWI